MIQAANLLRRLETTSGNLPGELRSYSLGTIERSIDSRVEEMSSDSMSYSIRRILAL